ncbi:uncharacterized protein N7483_001108 [Penicillium malachiteum]|uniref:uncharacterized protein n=1 Tax=Penicillium malachiteum TaxID=1324776 RepID=UPI0025482D6A|nr:uncharacterized protein N7483_001108 [Penicillium malachiteum]KAJ5735983.1 hypothetical protein N7483_001108 [Penicillium malachiteum]
MAIFQSILNALFGLGQKFNVLNPAFQFVRTTLFSYLKEMMKFTVPAFYFRIMAIIEGGEQTIGIVVWGFKWGTGDRNRDGILPLA